MSDKLHMSDKSHSTLNTQSFEESFRALVEEFFFGTPRSSEDILTTTSEATDSKSSGGWTLNRPTLEGSYPQTCIAITFHNENQPEKLFGYKWPIWLDYTNESVRDLAIYFHAHVCELLGSYETGRLLSTEEPLASATGASSRDPVTWLKFSGPR